MMLLLEERELLDLGEGLRGMRIDCLDGRCWLTQAGDSRDHLLGKGDHFTVRTGGRLIISATKACRLQLRPKRQHTGRPLLPHTLASLLRICSAVI
ncbi:MAG: DUF2917 domain-containing protein [Desulfuromonadales bacterium]